MAAHDRIDRDLFRDDAAAILDHTKQSSPGSNGVRRRHALVLGNFARASRRVQRGHAFGFSLGVAHRWTCRWVHGRE